MLQSKLFTKTRKEAPKDEVAKNAQLLVRAGFVHKEMAGVYSYLPLGLRVLKKLENIIREEMNAVGGQEISMTALQGREIWEKTGRWDDGAVDDWFKTKLKNGTELGLGFTHEEPVARIMSEFVSSYKDLPFSAYQFQVKFRNEKRAKSGVIRGREFLMKDLYSFSKDEEEHNAFYEKMKGVYGKVFKRAGIGDRTYLTISSGGSFSKYSYEFQTITDAGEDTILYDGEKKLAINKNDYSEEIFADFNLNKNDFNFKEAKSSEVGDIYSLGYKYSEALGLNYRDEKGEERPVYMGSYGIGVPRLMGTIVEVFADEKGMVWPEAAAPFLAHLIEIKSKNPEIGEAARGLYAALQEGGIEVLYDDREDASAGEKFADSDLIGIPWRIVVSEKTAAGGKFELKNRKTGEVTMESVSELMEKIKGGE